MRCYERSTDRPHNNVAIAKKGVFFVRKFLIVSAASFFSLALTAAAIAAPIELSRTHASVVWHGRSVMDVQGEMNFPVRATSAQPIEIESQNCRQPGQNLENTIAERTGGLKAGSETHNGHTVHSLEFGIRFGYKAGTCTFVLRSGADRATLTLQNSGRPARE